MLEITIPASELWNEQTFEFVPVKPQTLVLEHSLVSISKWESKWHKCFLSNKNKTSEEILDYVKCMVVNKQPKEIVISSLTNENLKEINAYIENPMTASCLPKEPSGPPSREAITSELIYYWMVAFNIPFECQKWHINRLLTLIKICSIKNQPPKKTGAKQILSRNAALNAARRKQLNSTG